MGRVDGRVVMITGAARALGRSHAEVFAREGADLLLVDLCAGLEGPYAMPARRDLEDTADVCRAEGGQVLTAMADVRDQAQIDAAVAAGLAEFGRIDVLVNNAGLLGPGGRAAHELSESDWQLVVDVNLNGSWRCAKAVLPSMVRRRAGAIVNTASTAGFIAYEMFASYVASKHAVIGLTKALAVEYAHTGIRVNAVCPTTVRADPELGMASTAAVAAAVGVTLGDYEASSAARHPMRRLVGAEEVSAACLWLASDEASGTTGTSLVVDCGYLAR